MVPSFGAPVPKKKPGTLEADAAVVAVPKENEDVEEAEVKFPRPLPRVNPVVDGVCVVAEAPVVDEITTCKHFFPKPNTLSLLPQFNTVNSQLSGQYKIQ